MAKRGSNGADSFFDRMFRPLKKSRVSMTKAGKSQAPLRKGKGTKKGDKAARATEKTQPLTSREKQVRELKMLADIGKRDPERLAGMISRLLLDGQEKDEAARQKFEQLVWEKAEKRKSPTDSEEGSANEDDAES